MKNKDCISRYLLIVRRLTRGQRATFEDIQRCLYDASMLTGEDYSISIRTFQRDLEAIRELFLIDIQYSRSEGVYYLCEELSNEAMSERMMESLEVFRSLKMIDTLDSVFHFEPRPALGTEHLGRMISAIKGRNVIVLVYNKNWENEYAERTLLPLLLKEFRGRWYIVAKRMDTADIHTYSLDRVVGFTITDRRAVPPANIDSYFQHSFGIYGKTNPEPQKVVLKFKPEAGKYVKEAVMHHSQSVVCDNGEEFTIALNILITFDFVMEILAYGDHVEVLSPPELRLQVADRLAKAVKIYK